MAMTRRRMATTVLTTTAVARLYDWDYRTTMGQQMVSDSRNQLLCHLSEATANYW